MTALRRLADAGGCLHSPGSGCYPESTIEDLRALVDLVPMGLACHGGYGAATATWITAAGRAALKETTHGTHP